MSLVRAVAEKRIGMTPTMARYAFECPLCEACDMCEIIPVPPPHAGPGEVIRFLRHQLVREGMVPKAVTEKYGEDREGRISRLRSEMAEESGIRETDADRVLFVEGTASGAEGGMYAASKHLISKTGRPVGVFEAGRILYDLYDLGLWDELGAVIKERTPETVKTFEEAETDLSIPLLYSAAMDRLRKEYGVELYRDNLPDPSMYDDSDARSIFDQAR